MNIINISFKENLEELKRELCSRSAVLNIFVWIVMIGMLMSCSVVKNYRIRECENKNKEYCEKISELEAVIVECDEVIRVKDEEIWKLEEYLGELREGNMGVVDNDFKSYMSFRMLKKNSEQGKIVYGSNTLTDEEGLRVWEEDGIKYYCVALGSYYGKVGDKFWVETDKGNTFCVIKADEKADKHTDSTNRYTLRNGCVMEWIVDVAKLKPSIRTSGNVNNINKISGKIVTITKIEV